jgi:hypothetical protein
VVGSVRDAILNRPIHDFGFAVGGAIETARRRRSPGAPICVLDDGRDRPRSSSTPAACASAIRRAARANDRRRSCAARFHVQRDGRRCKPDALIDRTRRHDPAPTWCAP